MNINFTENRIIDPEYRNFIGLRTFVLLIVMFFGFFTSSAQNWQAVSTPVSGSSTIMLGTSTVGANGVWLVGNDQTILRSLDGGQSWENRGGSGSLWFVKPVFTSIDKGFVAHSTGLYSTNDGGNSWSNLSVNQVRDVHFIDENTGWFVAWGGVIAKTVDGGINWNYQTSGTVTNLESVYFIDQNNGFVTGRAGLVMHTVDGGQTWTTQTSGIGSTLEVWGVHMYDTQIAWIVGPSGQISKTTNGGATWVPQSSGVTQRLLDINFIDDQIGWAVGGGGIILSTTNGGATWVIESSGTTVELNDIEFSDDHIAWVTGATGMVLKNTTLSTLIADYPFNGNASDASGNGHDGTINGATSSTDRFANNDAAYSFNGVDQDITISDVDVIFSEITVSVWLNFGTGQGDGAHTLIDLSGLAGIALEDNEILGVLNIQNDYSITNKQPLNPNEWHHVTMTYDQSDLVLFVDGEIASVRNLPGLITQEATLYDMTIGRIGFELNRYYGGILDDIRIFNRALSSSEVAGLYTEKGYVSQRDILMTLYNSTDGANWFNNTGWGTAADLSTWHGLTLENGNVASLDLRSNNLNGTIPASIAELQSLNELFFFNNPNLGGAIPAELGNLTNLTRLSFQACSMTGDIPAELGNLTSLTYLVLGPNQLTGSVPDSFANFANITIFAIHQNQLTSLPDLSGMPATIFWVQDNKFTFDELLVNLPQANTANANFGPQTADESYEYIAANGETIELSTNETALGTTYQWYFDDAIIEGADLVNHIFDFTSADEGTYYCVMVNNNVHGVTIKRANIILDNGINAIPTGIELSNNILNDGELAGSYVGSFTTIDEDPADMHTYSLVAGIGDTFNGEFIIEEDQLIISTDVDFAVNPVYQIRISTADASGEIFEQTFEVLVKPAVVCNNDAFNTSSGTFGDGSGIFDYENNFSCSWLITLPEGSIVKLSFTEFNTELDYDYVRVYDGSDDTAPLLAQLSGDVIPSDIYTTSNYMYVTFIADVGLVAPGWQADYSTVKPVAYFSFSGNAQDESGYNNHGTVGAGITLTSDRFGNPESAYLYDGSGSSIIGSGGSLPTGSSPRTVSGWIRRDANSSNLPGLMFRYGGLEDISGSHFGLGLGSSNEVWFWGHSADIGGTLVQDNKWHHLVVTYDGLTVITYLDGIQDELAELELNTLSGTDFYIGGNPGAYEGAIDDIQVYDYALSPVAISKLYTDNGWPNVSANLLPNLSSASGKRWKLAPSEGAFSVGPTAGSSEWYANGLTDVNQRDCLFDDQFIFYDDGTFLIDLNGLIWGEDYLGNVDLCVTIEELPTAFQVLGQGVYSYTTDVASANSTITVNGEGAFLGFSKAFNGGEYPTDGTGTPVSSITYTVLDYEVVDDKEYMTVTIDISTELDGSIWWTYKLIHDPLVASYAFEDNADDQTSNNLDGLVNGAIAVNDRFGAANAAYSLDGISAFIQTPAILTDNTPFSISTWVKWAGGTDFEEIVSWWESGVLGNTYLGIQSGELRFGDAWGNTGAFLAANQWVFLVATYDGDVSRIYMDGSLAATSASGSQYGFGANLYIGKQGTNDTEYFGGLIDDIDIYARQLSDVEILAAYDANKTDVLAYYPFRNDLTDAIGNGFNGVNPTSGNAFTSDRLASESSAPNAYNFDYLSGGAIELQNTANYDFGDEITVMTWIRPDSYETNDIAIIDNVIDGLGFHLYLVPGNVASEELSFKRKLYAAIPGVSWGDAGEVLTDRWTHIAFRYTRGCCVQLFINGQIVGGYGLAEGGEDSPIAVSSNSLMVGTDLNGILDELKIFKTALTDDEILAEYNINLWPFDYLALRGPELAELAIDRNLGTINGSQYIKAITLENAGGFQFRATPIEGSEAFMGDAELDGVAEPGGTLIDLPVGFYAVGFNITDLSYYITEINSVGFIGSALTGDETGWNSDVDLVEFGNGIYQIQNLKVYDGEWKLRINDAWGGIDWGSNTQNGSLDYFGSNIGIGAGTYTITADLINNRYTVVDYGSGDYVAELEFDGDLLDISGYDNHGTSASSIYTTNRFGDANSAILLGANDFVNIGTAPELNLNNGFSMNIWINPVNNNNAGGLFTSTGSFHQHLYSIGFDWRYFQNGQEFPINGIPVTAPNNTWTMFTWVYDGGEMRFYDDGVLVHTEPVFGDLDLRGNSYDIGNGYDGALDEFIWIDGVLSNYQITSLFNDGYVGRYAFDGNATDATSNGYDGVEFGLPTYGSDRFGFSSGALVLDGVDDYIDLGTDPAQHLTEELTLATWIKGDDQINGGILSWSLGFRLEIRENEGTVNFGTFGLSNDIMTSTTQILDGQWHLVVGTYDGTTKSLYVDGELEAEQTNVSLQGNPYQYGEPIVIGRDVNANLFTGQIDDAAIFDRAITAEEVYALYGENSFVTPMISGIFPTSGAPGSKIRVYGKNLDKAGTMIDFGGTLVAPDAMQDDVLYFTIVDLPYGSYRIRVVSDFDASHSQTFTVLSENSGNPSFIESATQSISTLIPYAMHLADFNEDGYPDMVISTYNEGDIYYYQNDLAGGFETAVLLYDGISGFGTFRSADMNNDGHLDLIMSLDGSVLLIKGNGVDPFYEIVSILTGANISDIAVGDLSKDGIADLVVIENGFLDWYENDGDGNLTTETSMNPNAIASKIELNDLDNDGDLDVAIANGNSSSSYLINNDGSFVFNALTSLANGTDQVITADLNNDGFIDMVAGEFNDNTVDVFLNSNGSLPSTPLNINSVPTFISTTGLAAGDMNGDGQLDLITAFYNSGTVAIYEWDGVDNFDNIFSITSQSQVSNAQAADIDADGDLDIVLTREDGTLSIFENIFTESKILDFTFGIEGETITINEETKTITVELPSTANFNQLIAVFEITSGATARVNDIIQESGITFNNFRLPVEYAITSEDLSTISTYTVNVSITSGLLVSYGFNGNTNDESGNGFNGTITGNVALTTDRFGNADAAYSFDGDGDFIRASGVPTSGTLTASGWFRSNKNYATGFANFFNFASVGMGISATNFLDGAMQLTEGNYTILSSSSQVNNDIWHHGVVTFDGAAMKLYLDGAMIAESTGHNGDIFFTNNFENLEIGYVNAGEEIYFTGSIDDVRIYNYAISDADIQVLYTEGGWPPSSLPSELILSSSQILENRSIGTEIGIFTTIDDDSDTFTYSLVSGSGDNDNARFIVEGDRLLSNAIFDYESKTSYSILVRTDDGDGGFLDQQFTISILNENDLITDPYQIEWIQRQTNYITHAEYLNGELVIYKHIYRPEGTFGVLHKLSQYGEVTWTSDSIKFQVQANNISGSWSPYSFEIDGDGNIYALGTIQGSIKVNGNILQGNNGGYDMLVVKYDADGNIVRYEQIGGAGNENGYGFILLPSGNLLISFDYSQTFSYQSILMDINVASSVHLELNNALEPTGVRVYDGFGSFTLTSDNRLFISGNGRVGLRELSTSDFSELATHDLPEAFEMYAHTGKLVVDSNNDLILTATEITTSAQRDNLDIFIGKFSTTSNTWDWYERVGGTGEDFADRLGIDDQDNIYLGGGFRFSWNWGGVGISSRGEQDIFLTKYDNAGNQLWIQTYGSSFDGPSGASDYLQTMAIDPVDEDVFLSAYFQGIDGVFLDQNLEGEMNIMTRLSGEGATPIQIDPINGYGAYTYTEVSFRGFFSDTYTLTATGAFTAEALVRYKGFSGPNDCCNSFIHSNYFNIYVDYDTNEDIYLRGTATGDPDNNRNDSNVGNKAELSEFAPDVWHHVALVVGDGAMNLYLDGKVVHSGISNFNSVAVADEFLEVITNQSADVDEVKIWNYARYGDELFPNISKELTLPQTGLTGYWRFNSKQDDGGGFYTPDLTDRGNHLYLSAEADIVEVNVAPTNIQLSNNSIIENRPAGTLIGTLSTVDSNINDTHTYRLIPGVGDDDNASFDIVNGEVVSKEAFDLTTKSAYSIRVETNDGFGGIFGRSLGITILNDPNSPPTDIVLSENTLEEGLNIGTLIGDFSSTDADGGDTHTYALISGVAGNDNASFEISGNQLLTKEVFVQATKSSYSIKVESNDGNFGTYQKDFTITILENPNSAPTLISFVGGIDTIPENEAAGTTVLTLITTDANVDDTHTYSITSDPTSSFKIDENNNNRLLSTKVFNYEVDPQAYTIQVRTEDNFGGVLDQNLTINIGDVDDPTFITEISAPTSYTLGGVGISVTVKIADEDGLSAATILYRKLAASNYTEESLTDLGDNYSFTIDNGSFDNLGVEFYFFAQDRFGSVNSASTVIYSEVATDAIDISSNVSPGMLEANYRILAFPFQTTKVSDVFSELGTIDKTKWRLLRWKNNTSSYEDLTTSSTLSAGEGYWFLSSETVSVKTGGKSVTLVDGVYKINLGAEWNLFGNPFQGSLNWAKVLEHNITNNVIQDGNVATTLDGWSGSWNDKTSLSSFEGAFINVTTAVTGFEIPASAVTGAGRESESIRKPQEVNIDNEEWDFRMYFKTPSYSYNAGGIGMKPNAEDEADYFDKQQLPNFSTYLDMMFEEGVIRSTKKTDDFKTWNFTVPNSLPEKYIDMTWDIPVSFGKTIIFVDAASHQIYDLSKTRNIQLANNPSAKHQLYYGDKAEIYANLNLPFDALFNIYPNPVSDWLNLEIYSKENKTSTIEFISIEGKSVYRELLDLQLGVTTKQIDLLGKSIPNGVYLISIDHNITSKFIKQ